METSLRVKNSWEEGQIYRAVNIAVTGPKGEKWEFQVHSPESKKLAQLIHPDYERYRASYDNTERATAYARMMKKALKMRPPYAIPGDFGAMATSLSERNRLLGVGKRVRRGYQSAEQQFGEEAVRQYRSSRAAGRT